MSLRAAQLFVDSRHAWRNPSSLHARCTEKTVNRMRAPDAHRHRTRSGHFAPGEQALHARRPALCEMFEWKRAGGNDFQRSRRNCCGRFLPWTIARSAAAGALSETRGPQPGRRNCARRPLDVRDGSWAIRIGRRWASAPPPSKSSSAPKSNEFFRARCSVINATGVICTRPGRARCRETVVDEFRRSATHTAS